jgi:hypothetical protein
LSRIEQLSRGILVSEAKVNSAVLEAIEPANINTALALLNRGFPERPLAFWETAFERLQRLGTNAATGVPLGYLMRDGKRKTGVLLTPASVRSAADGRRALVVNLSSWYVEPSHRALAPHMLKSILCRHEAMYTDLTPSELVRKMLPSMGFVSINDGVLLTALPVAATLSSLGATVGDLTGSGDVHLSSDVWDLLEAHRRVGCIPAILTTAQDVVPIMFRPRMLKGLSAANVIYCENTTVFQKHLAAVARYLLRHGIVVLVHDNLALPKRSGQIALRKELKFAKPGAGLAPQRGRIDHAGSELSLMDI